MKRTTEEIAAWHVKMKEIARQIKAMPDAERQELAQRLGTTTPEGHTLSAYNTVFLWIQAGKALPMIGGFWQWQRAGRKVIKGEHACGVIYVPLQHKHTEDDKDDTPDDVSFRLVPVFALEQTEDANTSTSEPGPEISEHCNTRQSLEAWEDANTGRSVLTTV